ncbi:MAG: hypothetical protein ACOYLI_12860 [Synechococcus lacustris]
MKTATDVVGKLQVQAEGPHSSATVQMPPGDWRLELEGVGWFRAFGGRQLSWQRWDDSVSDRDLRTFLVTSGLGALLIQRGALVLNGTTLVLDGKAVLLLASPVSCQTRLLKRPRPLT